MPELPDIEVYLERLRDLTAGQTLEATRVTHPFLLRTVDPHLDEAVGAKVVGFERLGKRIVMTLEGELHLVFHLMIAGRLHWAGPHAKVPRRRGLAGFYFPKGTLLLTEAGSKRRASLHVVRGKEGLEALDPGGIEVFDATPEAFASALTRRNHTLKRALTDPRIFSGIGNAYSDEILHRAQLSPVRLTQKLAPDEIARLHDATTCTLRAWTERLRTEVGKGFPDKVTAFRPGMAVHGRYGKPCPICGEPIQRIRYAQNETNYCAACQNAGRLLADRSLSRLLKKDWPRTLEELEELKAV